MLNVCVSHLFPGNMDKANLPILNTHLLPSDFTQEPVKYTSIMLGTPGLKTNPLTEIAFVMAWT